MLHHVYTFPGKSEETGWPSDHGECKGRGVQTSQERCFFFFLVGLFGLMFNIQHCSDVQPCSSLSKRTHGLFWAELPTCGFCAVIRSSTCWCNWAASHVSCWAAGAVSLPWGWQSQEDMFLVPIQREGALDCGSSCKALFELGLVLGLQNCRLGCIQDLAVCYLLKAVFEFCGWPPGHPWATVLVTWSPAF